MAAFTLHQLSRSQSIAPTFTIHLFSFHNKLLQVPSHPAHRLLEEFFPQIRAVPPYFFFKTLPCYKLVLNLMMLRSYCIPASQRCPKGHLAFSSQRLEFKYKLTGITFLILYFFNQYYLFIGASFVRDVWSWTMLRTSKDCSVKNITL